MEDSQGPLVNSDSSTPVIHVVSGAARRDGRYLITQRHSKAVFGEHWEFPGGKVESGETLEQALKREVHYRLGTACKVGEQISSTERDYSDYRVVLHLFDISFPEDEPTAVHVKGLAWLSPSEMESYLFVPADRVAMDHMLGFSDTGSE